MRLEDKLMIGVLAGTLYCGNEVMNIRERNQESIEAYKTCSEHVSGSYCVRQREPLQDDQWYLLGALFGVAVLSGSAMYRLRYGSR